MLKSLPDLYRPMLVSSQSRQSGVPGQSTAAGRSFYKLNIGG